MNIIYPNNRQELREWFSANHTTEKEIWVCCIRREHDSILSYLDVVEEALCFGWIDSTTRSNPDGEGYFQRLSPRRKNSNWTELNKERCRRLKRLGLMTEWGEKVLPSLDEEFEPQPWIIEAIRRDPAAWENHKKFHPLYLRVRLYNIEWTRAKVSEEKAAAMLDKYIKAAREGKTIGEWNDGGRLLE